MKKLRGESFQFTSPLAIDKGCSLFWCPFFFLSAKLSRLPRSRVYNLQFLEYFSREKEQETIATNTCFIIIQLHVAC